MKQRIYVQKDTNRVKASYVGRNDFIDAQRTPDGCYHVDVDQQIELTNDWVYSNGRFIYDPVVIEKSYRMLRYESYPPIGDQLDAILKMALALRSQNIPIPQDTVDWINKCLEVKDRYPKP